MQCLETRIESFKRAKGRKAFPHHGRGYERLTPTALAEAGFFYNPDADMPDDDTCNCFLCGLQLGGWEAGDDPFAEHVKREGVCAWKELVCRLQLAEDGEGRLRTEFPDKSSLPSSKKNSDLRVKTYGSWWPHSKPTPKQLAEGGFIYAPSVTSPDATRCLLCDYEVEDWEKGDNPKETHRNRMPECPFFTAEVVKKARAKQPARRARSTTTTRAKSPEAEAEADNSTELPDPAAMEAEAEAFEQEDEQEEEVEEAPRRRGRPPKASTASTVGSTSTKAGRRTTTTKAREKEEKEKELKAEKPKATRKKAAKAAEPEPEDVEEIADEPEAAEPEAKRDTKPLPRRRTTRQTTAESEAEPPAPKPRGRPKKVTLGESTSSTKAKASTARTKAKPLAQADSLANVPPEPRAPASPVKSPSVQHAVALMVQQSTSALGASTSPATSASDKDKDLPPLPPMPALTDEQRNMTLEEYIRSQYKVRGNELRADAEASLQKFAAAAAQARATLERGER